jgi:hypothetical protein
VGLLVPVKPIVPQVGVEHWADVCAKYQDGRQELGVGYILAEVVACPRFQKVFVTGHRVYVHDQVFAECAMVAGRVDKLPTDLSTNMHPVGVYGVPILHHATSPVDVYPEYATVVNGRNEAVCWIALDGAQRAQPEHRMYFVRPYRLGASAETTPKAPAQQQQQQDSAPDIRRPKAPWNF